MNKSEFLLGLKKALSSTDSAELIDYNMKYYSEYIDNEIRNGRAEEDVLEELGDPRLIAHSIKDAEGISNNYIENEYNEKTNSDKNAYNEKGFKVYSMSPLFAKISLILIVITLVSIVILAVSAVVGVINFLWPVLAPILLVVIVMWLMKFLSNR